VKRINIKLVSNKDVGVGTSEQGCLQTLTKRILGLRRQAVTVVPLVV